MSIAYVCDYCGRPIGPDEPSVELKVTGRVPSPGWVNGTKPVYETVGHYHTDPFGLGESCYRQVRSRIGGANEHGSAEDDEVAAHPYWTGLPVAERDRLTLNSLSNDRLTIRELTERMRAELDAYTNTIFESNIRSILGRLLRTREVDREGEPFRKGTGVRYRYFARRDLEGPIADLDRAFRKGEG